MAARVQSVASLCALVLLFSAPAARAQQMPSLEDILTRLNQNLTQYKATLPSFFCNEHVVSEASRKLSRVPFNHKVTDSILRIKRTGSPSSPLTFVESHDVQMVDGFATSGHDLEGPTTLSGAFSNSLSFVSPDLIACVRYHLHPIQAAPQSNSNNPVYRIDFASLPSTQRPASCVITEGVVGAALIDSESMQITHLEFVAPRHDNLDGLNNDAGEPKGTWSVSVDYASVLLGEKTFWMPKMITSVSTASGHNPVIFSFTAQYSDYHKLDVSSHILPFSGKVIADTRSSIEASQRGRKSNLPDPPSSQSGKAPQSAVSNQAAALAPASPTVETAEIDQQAATSSLETPAIQTLHVYVNRIQVPVLVLDHHQRPVQSVLAYHFSVSLDSGPRFRPDHVRVQGDDPLSMAILLDLTGSQDQILPRMVNEVSELAQGSLHTEDHLSLYILGCSFTPLMVAKPADADGIGEAVRQLRMLEEVTRSSTQTRAPPCTSPGHLWDSLEAITSELTSETGRRVIVAVTDGRDGGSSFTWNQAREDAQFSSVSVFGLTSWQKALPIAAPATDRLEFPFYQVCGTTGGVTRRRHQSRPSMTSSGLSPW